MTTDKSEQQGSWVKATVLTVLASFGIELWLMLYGSLSCDRRPYDFVPWTFTSVWALLASGGILWLVHQLKVHVGTFIAAVFLGLIPSVVILVILKLCLPDNFTVLKPAYLGVESRRTMESTEGGHMFDRLEVGFLYRSDDPQLLRDYEDAWRGNAFVNCRGFLTWQAGLAQGFMPDPLSVPQYPGTRRLSDRFFLALTVGPVMLAELFINGLVHFFLVLLALQIVWFLVRKQHMWWDKGERASNKPDARDGS
jgi:hypothetical protein